MDRPTVEARQQLATTAQRHAEDARVHIRKHHQTAIKKGGFKKHSEELDEVCTMQSIQRQVSCPATATKTLRQVCRRSRQGPRGGEKEGKVVFHGRHDFIQRPPVLHVYLRTYVTHLSSINTGYRYNLHPKPMSSVAHTIDISRTCYSTHRKS